MHPNLMHVSYAIAYMMASHAYVHFIPFSPVFCTACYRKMPGYAKSGYSASKPPFLRGKWGKNYCFGHGSRYFWGTRGFMALIMVQDNMRSPN